MREELEWRPTPLDQEIMTLLDDAGAGEVKLFSRRVHDGVLHAIVSNRSDHHWYLTLKHLPKRAKNERYPTWEEVTNARYELLPGKLTMALYLPPIEEVHEQRSVLNLIEVKTIGD